MLLSLGPQIADISEQPKGGWFLTLDHMGTPLKIKISKNVLKRNCMLERNKNMPRAYFFLIK